VAAWISGDAAPHRGGGTGAPPGQLAQSRSPLLDVSRRRDWFSDRQPIGTARAFHNDMRKTIIVTIGILAAFGVTAARAEDVKIQAPAPTPAPAPMPEPRIIAPDLLYEMRPKDENYYPGPSVPYDPAFIRPLTTTVESADSTGRTGLSGWTSPNTPVGSAGPGQHESSGWLSFGFTWTWGGPAPAHRPGAAEDQPPVLAR
jgi:hypothetical protein